MRGTRARSQGSRYKSKLRASVMVAFEKSRVAAICSLLILARALRNTPCLLIGNPFRDSRVQNVERQRTRTEHFIVKGADVVFGAEFFFRQIAQFENLHLAQLVSQGLARPRDVAVHFGLDVGFVHGGMLAEEVHHSLAGPVLVMNSGL